MYDEIPNTIEEIDPELDKLMKWFCDPESNMIGRGNRIDAVVQEPIQIETKIERNKPCPCGSGKKYKKCCFNKGR